MKILSVEVEGLWSYREPQRIDIAGLPLIVGVGENGAGKSALLIGALVAAFYGRFQTKTIEESITTGAPAGHVSVEFEVNGAKYRIGRNYPRSGAASASLLIGDETKKSGWRPLTEKGIKEVNAFIVELLGMDYETATMTWIAEQGQYGKFSGAAPAERFKLLSTVFGLDSYIPKAAAASAKLRAAEANVTRLDGRIAELSDSLEIIPTDGPDIAGYTALTDEELEERAATVNADIDRISLEIAQLDAADPARQTIEARQAYELVRNERQAQLTAATDKQTRAELALERARKRATTELSNAEERFNTALATAERRHDTAKETAAANRRAAFQALSDIGAAEASLGQLTDTVTAFRDAAAADRATAGEWAAQVSALRIKHGLLKAQVAANGKSIDDATARIALLQKTAADSDHAECFTCGQHLTAGDAAALIALQEQAIATLHTERAAIVADGKQTNVDIEAAEQGNAAAIAAAEANDKEAEQASVAVLRATNLIATKAEREAAEDGAVKLLADADREHRDADKAASAERTATVTATETERDETVATASAELDEAIAAINATTEPGEREVQLLDSLNAAIKLVEGASAEYDARRDDLKEERTDARRVASEISAEAARRVEQAAARAEQEARLASIIAERAAADKDRTLNSLLHKAYSPAGIPAMVLAGVITELNEAVNVALEKLSRGELSVELRTTRETTKGTAENKVTVYVQTPTGLRAYESLSGGQKFRVDLAIRTGLAAAIARGTGTPIETFVLDEGWGTLDEKGILSTIDTLFRLSETTNVVTVSHIDSVRDAFPVRVSVSMSGGNSVAEVIR